MIVKSMARKEPTFAQLYDYITREGDYDKDYCFTRNFILRDRDAILNEFERNANLLSKRKNGNYLYHEIISITRAEGLREKEQKDLLFKIVQQYAESRAKDCLVFGGLHVEKDNNLHFHLVISANELNQSRRYRLSKHQFSEVKIGLETHVLEHHPELEQEKLISAGRKEGKAKISNREDALKRRTGKPTQKELFREKLEGIFAKSVDKNDFFNNLEKDDIECYTRGKTIGFLDRANGRRHRLKTLGLVAEFEVIQSKIGGSQESEKTSQRQSDKSQQAQKAKSKPKQQKTTQARQAEVKSKAKSQAKQSVRDEEAIAQERAEEIKQTREKAQRESESKQGNEDSRKRWWIEDDMVDILGMFDAVLNALNVAKTAGDVDEDSKKSNADQVTDETKEKMDEIIEKREQEIKQRRADQSTVSDQDRQRHKRWLKGIIQMTKNTVFRIVKRLNHYLLKDRKDVNKTHV